MEVLETKLSYGRCVRRKTHQQREISRPHLTGVESINNFGR